MGRGRIQTIDNFQSRWRVASKRHAEARDDITKSIRGLSNTLTAFQGGHAVALSLVV